MRALPVALALAIVFALQLSAAGVLAAEVSITATSIENNHPKDLVWKVTATAPVDITDVTLQYRLKGSQSSAFGKPEQFTAGTSISTSVRVETNPNGQWIPVGNEFTWHWEFTLADGSIFSSKDETFVYLPTNHTWQTLNGGIVTVYYFGERSNLVQQFVTAADEVAARIGKDLLNTQLDFLPVRIVLLANERETAQNEPSKGSTFDQQRAVVVCGFRPSGSTDLIIGTISCGGSDPVETFRHEFGHLITKAAGETSLVKVPSWLDEGMAVTSQKSGAEFTTAFNALLRTKKDIFPFTSMNNYPSDSNLTIAWYGQAFAMTQYLIQKYGPQKMALYFAAMKKNTRADIALQQVFGIDLKAFEDGFRAAVLPAGQPTVAPTPRQQQTQRTPTAAPVSQVKPGASSGGGSDFDKKSLAIIGGSLVFALLAVFSFLMAMIMQNNRQRAGVAAGSAPAQPPPPDDPPPTEWTRPGE